jgi:hypothetical protein
MCDYMEGCGFCVPRPKARRQGLIWLSRTRPCGLLTVKSTSLPCVMRWGALALLSRVNRDLARLTKHSRREYRRCSSIHLILERVWKAGPFRSCSIRSYYVQEPHVNLVDVRWTWYNTATRSIVLTAFLYPQSCIWYNGSALLCEMVPRV